MSSYDHQPVRGNVADPMLTPKPIKAAHPSSAISNPAPTMIISGDIGRSIVAGYSQSMYDTSLDTMVFILPAVILWRALPDNLLQVVSAYRRRQKSVDSHAFPRDRVNDLLISASILFFRGLLTVVRIWTPVSPAENLA